MVKDKSRKGGQTAVRLDPVNDGVQPDILQRRRDVILHERQKDKCRIEKAG